jgi:cysteinyl-tRNA synthetase
MYVCGLTVYDDAHIGHARTYVSFDAIRRYLEYRGFDVTYVQNITNVEDKIINAANESGLSFLEHGDKYTQRAMEDLGRLGIRPADLYPKVTEYMDEIIRITERIIENGHAYVTASGSVYYDVTKKEGYGKLSNRSVEEMQAGARVEVSSEKRHPADFALWKAAKPDEPHWDSPWGKGRPGWHIECSAMAKETLDQPFDIHGGGRDLIFPHHENEIAQSEAAYGTDFARYWLHTGFLQVEGVKMSKSLGNFVTVRELLERHDADAVRYFYVLTHYRSPIDFSEKGIKEAKTALDRLRRTEEEMRKRLEGRAYRADPHLAEAAATSDEDKELHDATRRFRAAFEGAMDDDFNTPEAIAALHAFAGDIRRVLSTGPMNRVVLAWAHHSFVEAAHVLTVLQDTHADTGSTGDDPALAATMGLLLELREAARKNKDWATADRVRDGLAAAGFEVQDTPDGAKWRRA